MFAFDDIGICAVYFNSVSQNPHYYRVKLSDSVACPMCLTDGLKNPKDKLINLKIADEYWIPKQEWKVLEYLSYDMEILEIVDKLDLIHSIRAQQRYQADFGLRKKFTKTRW